MDCVTSPLPVGAIVALAEAIPVLRTLFFVGTGLPVGGEKSPKVWLLPLFCRYSQLKDTCNVFRLRYGGRALPLSVTTEGKDMVNLPHFQTFCGIFSVLFRKTHVTIYVSIK